MTEAIYTGAVDPETGAIHCPQWRAEMRRLARERLIDRAPEYRTARPDEQCENTCSECGAPLVRRGGSR